MSFEESMDRPAEAEPDDREPVRSLPDYLHYRAEQPTYRSPGPLRIMVAAFEGWNDAGEAATDAVEELATQAHAEQYRQVNDDDYYDFQMTRPVVTRAENSLGQINWPQTRILHSAAGTTTEDQPDLYFMLGVEPSLRWRAFVSEIVEVAEDLDLDAVVMVGSYLSDVPHSRPLTATLFSTQSAVRAGLEDVLSPHYEGPTGITGVIAEEAARDGFTVLSVWSVVPHYVSQAPSPKAKLGLVTRLEELLGMRVEVGSLTEDAEAWERGVDELAEEDQEVSDYIRRLEKAQDTEELPEASGESIAREFERFLRRRDDQQ
ncbi:PAC2 family protein [Auritidibacter ignavus]|uniref:PAC2 family protein n=1 Tax=Auritidibacter ignavus TaxID=678932 RepID=A0AAJ6AI62_9MICC|nr:MULTISPECIES: PAC2 family protein [Auritidibacter]WGH93710.1 PAC2 family protein [Auritidibacter ignavus]